MYRPQALYGMETAPHRAPSGRNDFSYSGSRSAFRKVGTSQAPVPTPVPTFLSRQETNPSQSVPVFMADSRWLVNNLAQQGARDWFPGGGNVYAPSPIQAQQSTPAERLGAINRMNPQSVPGGNAPPASYLPATMTITTAGRTNTIELEPEDSPWGIVPRYGDDSRLYR